MKYRSSIFIYFILLNICLSAQAGYLSRLNDLNFGDVFTGFSKEVLNTDAGAAKFHFYHTNSKSRNVFINFTLPTVLQNGTDQIPITFTQTHASWSLNDQVSGRTSFDPNSKVRLGKVNGNQSVYFWLGGAITTTSSTTPGIFTGDIVVTVDY